MKKVRTKSARALKTDDGNIQSERERSFLVFFRGARAPSFLGKVTSAMSTHFSYIRECNGVTARARG